MDALDFRLDFRRLSAFENIQAPVSFYEGARPQ
jgi:hypothetical protein